MLVRSGRRHGILLIFCGYSRVGPPPKTDDRARATLERFRQSDRKTQPGLFFDNIKLARIHYLSVHERLHLEVAHP